MNLHAVSGSSADACGAIAQVPDVAELVDVEGGFFITPVTCEPLPWPWLPTPFLPSTLS
jgi:hypothetical protein